MNCSTLIVLYHQFPHLTGADWTTEHIFRSQLHMIVVQTFPHFLRGRSGISRLTTRIQIAYTVLQIVSRDRMPMVT